EKSYGGVHSEYLADAQATPDYGFSLGGSSLSGKSGNKLQKSAGDVDYWIWKMNEKGDWDWHQSFGGSGSDFLSGIRFTMEGGYRLRGTAKSSKRGDNNPHGYGKEDCWIIKLNAEGGDERQRTTSGAGTDIVKIVRPTSDAG